MSAPANNNGNDAYLRFLQQANASVPAPAAATSVADDAIPHIKALTGQPTDTTLATAYEQLIAAANGLCYVSEADSDLKVVHIPTSDSVTTSDASASEAERFARLLGVDATEVTELSVEQIFAQAAEAAGSVGLAEDVARWPQLRERLLQLLGDAAQLKAWRVGRLEDAWLYIGGLVADRGFIGVCMHSVET